MKKTIEQVEKERDEAIAAALELADAIRKKIPPMPLVFIKEEIAAVEALRPEPPLLDGWVNVYSHGTSGIHESATAAVSRFDSTFETLRAAVHVREVRSVKWDRWNAIDGEVYGHKKLLAVAKDHYKACRIAEAHNTAMERLERGESV